MWAVKLPKILKDFPKEPKQWYLNDFAKLNKETECKLIFFSLIFFILKKGKF